MKNAAIDIGSNSILLYIEEDGIQIYDTGEITKLGCELADTGMLALNSMEDSLILIKKYVAICNELCVENIFAAGTMALRNAANASDFIKRVKNETGLEIEIISGVDEARMSYIGAASAVRDDASVKMIVDIGGGSTEFTCGRGDEIIRSVSLNIGVLEVSNKYLSEPFIKETDYILAKDNLEKKLRKLEMPGFDYLIGAGGSITNLASVKLGKEKFDAEKINGTILEKEDIIKSISIFSSLSLKERENITGLQKGRASTITAGAVIALAVLNRFNKKFMTVSSRGLRHGLLIKQRSTR